MEIDVNMKWGAVNGLPPAQPSAAGSTPPAVSDAFNSTSLEAALKNMPETRPETIARAQQSVNSPDYPSDETVKQLSSFFAGKLQNLPD